MENKDNENEQFGLDQVTDEDSQNVTTRNVATNLSSLTQRTARPLIKEDEKPLDKLDIDKILAEPAPAKPDVEEIVGLDKLSADDFDPDKRYKPVDLKFADPFGAKIKAPDLPEDETAPKTEVHGLTTTERQKEYQDMPFINKSDVKDFSVNTKVDTSILTQQYCRGCNKPLSNLEKKYFQNRCITCQKKYFDKYVSDTRIRYIILAIFLAVLVFLASFKFSVGSTEILVSNIIGLLMVCGTTFIFTLTTLAKKVNTNMISSDYMWICLLFIVLSYVFYTFLKPIYVGIAVAYSIYSVIRDARAIVAKKKIFISFYADERNDRQLNNK